MVSDPKKVNSSISPGRRLRVGFLIQNPSFSFAGSDAPFLQVRYIVDGLRSAGHQVDLLALRHARQVTRSDRWGNEQIVGVGWTGSRIFRGVESVVRRIQSTCHLPYLALFDSLRFIDVCVQELDQVDLIHERNTFLSLGPALASQYLKKPYVLSVDADPLLELDYLKIPMSGMQREYSSWAARYTYQHANAIICVSKAAKEHLVSNWNVPETKIYVIPNGVDPTLFSPDAGDSQAIRQHLGVGGAPVVMFIGGFWAWHDLALLVESFSQVLEDLPEARLVLVGDGVTRQSIMRQVAERHMERSVIFTGNVDHQTVPTYLNAANVAVVVTAQDSPNASWGSPMKLFEYMAAGKGIVASATGQVEEVIQNGENGILVHPGDVASLANAIVTLLKDDSLRARLGYAARADAASKYTWRQYAQKLVSVYSTVIQNQ